MAKFYNATEGLRDQIDKYQKQRNICLFCCYIVPFALLGIFRLLSMVIESEIIGFLGVAAPIIGLAVFIKLYNSYGKKIDISSAGFKGENRTKVLFLSLPDEYSVITNAIITFDGRRNELDSIVVGPTGVFIVEIKNYSGKILGNVSDHNLINEKHGGRKEFYNPIKQVGTHTYRLAHFLREKGIKLTVKNCVFFSNDYITIEVDGQEDCSTPILVGKANLLSYVVSGENVLSPETVKKICDEIVSSQN